MSLEAWILANSDKKEKSEWELKEELGKVIDFQKKKEKLRNQVETNNALSKLRELLESWILSSDELDAIENVINDSDIDELSASIIFEKIDEIANNPKVNLYIPESLRITKVEYVQALKDKQKKDALLQKIDTILSSLAAQISSSSWDKLNLFTWFPNKHLVSIQWNTIDIKRSLQTNI